MAGQVINIAKEETSQDILSKVDTEVATINTNLNTVDSIVDTINSNVSANKATLGTINTNVDNIYKKVDSEIDTLISNLAVIDSIVDTINASTASSTSANASGTLSQKLTYIINSLIGATNNSGGSASAGTVMAKLNTIISNMGGSGGLSLKIGTTVGNFSPEYYEYKHTLPTGVGWYSEYNGDGTNLNNIHPIMKLSNASMTIWHDRETLYYVFFV